MGNGIAVIINIYTYFFIKLKKGEKIIPGLGKAFIFDMLYGKIVYCTLPGFEFFRAVLDQDNMLEKAGSMVISLKETSVLSTQGMEKRMLKAFTR